MADITGPISSLPNSYHNLPSDAKCDEHEDRLAVARVQGETDSFGCEMIDMCQKCLDEHKEYQRTADRSGTCDWCKQHADYLSPARDYDEGMHGPVYEICRDCRKRRDDEAREELEEYYSGYDDYDDYYSDEED